VKSFFRKRNLPDRDGELSKAFSLVKSRISIISPWQNIEFMQLATGLYCHVPFCAHKCAYCAFYQEPPTSELIAEYIRGLRVEFSLLEMNKPFDTIYAGGGTPGLLSSANMELLCQILTQNNGKIPPIEFSVEFSPSTVKTEKLEILKHYNCNRVTIGVQSFNRETLLSLGRRQSEKQIFSACEIAMASGIGNIGIDLIFGVPGQTIAEWLADLRCAVNLHPKHISTYALTFENGTPLKRDLSSKIICKKTEEEEADFYLRTWEFLESNGYRQYEISNFCVPGFESVHNINTWKMQDWIGIGPAACSQCGWRRFSNPQSTARWLESMARRELAWTNIEKLGGKTMAEDSIIFGLRMNCGVNISAVKNKFKNVDLTALDDLFCQLQSDGLLQISGECVRLTTEGRLVADAIAVSILEVL
jgi:oxygen-independent coproporphyrinogen-3 oxidase